MGLYQETIAKASRFLHHVLENFEEFVPTNGGQPVQLVPGAYHDLILTIFFKFVSTLIFADNDDCMDEDLEEEEDRDDPMDQHFEENCNEHEHVTFNIDTNISQDVGFQDNEAEHHSEHSDDELGELQQQLQETGQQPSEDDFDTSSGSDDDPQPRRLDPEFDFGTDTIEKLTTVVDVNASSVGNEREMRNMQRRLFSEECIFGLLGNLWQRYPRMTKQEVKDHLAIWDVLTGGIDAPYDRWRKKVNQIMIRHKMFQYCEDCGFTCKKKDLDNPICQRSTCKDKKVIKWGRYITFSIEDQLRNVLQGISKFQLIIS
jgi:hypothetical protein